MSQLVINSIGGNAADAGKTELRESAVEWGQLVPLQQKPFKFIYLSTAPPIYVQMT